MLSLGGALLLALLLLAMATGSPAQQLHKCADGAGRITYASERCDKQGLRDAGPVRERTTVVPGTGAAKSPPAEGGPGQKAADPDAPGRAVSIKPVNPLVEKLLR